MKKVLFGLFAVAMLAAKSASAAPIMFVNFVEIDQRGDSISRLGTVDVGVAGPNANVNVIGTMLNSSINLDTMFDIAFDPFGNLWGVSGDGIWTIDKTTATANFVGAHNMGFEGNSLVFDSLGTLYAASGDSQFLYTINTNLADVDRGKATQVGVTGMGVDAGGDLAFLNGALYLAAQDNSLRQINPVTGTTVSNNGTFSVANMYGLATGDDGLLYGVSGTSIFQVNASTAALSNQLNMLGAPGTAAGQAFFQEAAAEPVPEPGSLLLLGGGLAAAVRRKRQKKSAEN